MSENHLIRPELIACKLRRARNFESEELLADITADPRRVEILWALQYLSQPGNYPGGIRRLASNLVAAVGKWVWLPCPR